MNDRPTSRFDAAAILALLLGLAGAGFAAFGLAITLMQRVMLAAMPPPEAPPDFPFEEGMRALHAVWFRHLPIWLVGGVLTFWAGWKHYRRRPWAPRAMMVLAPLGTAALIAYSIDAVVTISPTWRVIFATHPMMGSNFDTVLLANTIVADVIFSLPFVALFFLAWRARRREQG